MSVDYPLQFSPVYQEKIWGGNQLNKLLNKPSPFSKTGESWEISAIPGHESILLNGQFKGKNLAELCSEFPYDILGKRISEEYHHRFPLLIKFIDAKVPLSVQVHPNDFIAAAYQSSGKNEMWVILDAQKDSEIFLGFKKEETPESIQEALENETILDKIESYRPQKDDIFIVNAGTVHAIGKNIVLAEIQQTSDITFRLFDYGRKDEKGNLRELHLAESLQALNYSPVQNAYIPVDLQTPFQLVEHKNFKINSLKFDGDYAANTFHLDSFVVLMNLEGSVKLETSSGEMYLKQGDSVLLPYVLGNFTLYSDHAKLLQIWV
ncbi:MAG: class I mannose-6-phosphate isomerase [Flavobacteriaceae bacterium]|nr:class I mannose-6-phosphate isomerase [Flavobacteriaceae bacterium]